MDDLLTSLVERKNVILDFLAHVGAVQKYSWLQTQLHSINVSSHDAGEFQRRFKGFYRVRRNQAFCGPFFGLLEREKANVGIDFASVLLEVSTDRVEASFSSKLVASIRPDMPVWDREVMRNLGIRTTGPAGDRNDKIRATLQRYEDLGTRMTQFLHDAQFLELRRAFDQRFPGTVVSDMKVMDFFLWQYRPGSRVHGHGARVRGCGVS
jgi:hypothetical protein